MIHADGSIVDAVAGALESATGRPAAIQGMPYGSDMRLLVNQGNTATVLFGPGDVRRGARTR